MTYQELQKQQMDALESQNSCDTFAASMVEPTEDYANDQRKYLTIVTHPTKEIVSKITSTFMTDLAAADGEHYYCEPDSLHLTILSIRLFQDGSNFSPEKIAKIIAIIKEVFAIQKATDFEMKGTLELPTSIGVRCYSSIEFKNLIKNLRSALQKMGISSDKKLISDDIFFGNITVCRFRPNHHPSTQVRAVIKKYHDFDFGNTKLQTAQLIHSNAVLNSHHTKVLAEFNLA